MRTLGVDLSASPKKTEIAVISWAEEEGAPVLELVKVGADDEKLIDLIRTTDKTGIDCPLGWPVLFIDFVARHRQGNVEIDPGEASEWRMRLSYRVTDLDLKRQLPAIQGLSVSSDRIGVTTMRCAALLAQLASIDMEVDRAGGGKVVEVYPAASLLRWGLPHKGYKGSRGKDGRA